MVPSLHSIDDHDSEDDTDNDQARFSNSPRRWTQIISRGLQIPVKSEHREHGAMNMASIASQDDFALRTADFFDDDSSEDEKPLPGSAITSSDIEPRGKAGSPSRKKSLPASAKTLNSECLPKRSNMPPEEPDLEGYARINSNFNPTLPFHRATTPDTSFHGSREVMNPLAGDLSTPQLPKTSRLSYSRSSRTSGHGLERPSGYQLMYDGRSSMYSDKADQRLALHGVAYHVFLQGILDDPQLAKQNLVSQIKNIRTSLLSPQLCAARDQPMERTTSDHSAGAATAKKVHLVPPPIDTSNGTRTSENFVKTPYPFPPPKIHAYRKDFNPEPVSAMEGSTSSTDSILTLSIRRSNPNSKPRVTTIAIPASNDFSAVRTTSQSRGEKDFNPLVFDDEEFFRQLRFSYAELTGYARFFSAQSLTRIAVSGPATKAADARYGWLRQPRSPKVLAYKGLTDTFSEEKVLACYRKPALGKSRYAFVQWAHRLAAAPPMSQQSSSFPPTVMDDGQQQQEEEYSSSVSLIRKLQQPEGLEFIVSWSLKRIVLVMLVVVVLAIAAAPLWTFLGTNTPTNWPATAHNGFNGAGDRVGVGILIGLLVLFIGMTGVAGWIAVSWLIV